VVRRKAFAASTEKVPPKGVLAAASPSYGEVLAQWRGYRLGPDLILWQRDSIRTGFAVRTVFYLYHKGRAQPLRLPGAPSGSIGEVLVEPQRGTIRAASKAGSHGDCGMILSWGWTGAKAGFRQIEQLEMPLCQGLPERFWLRTYRTDHVIG
jgi:hypothetical protein